LRHGDIANKLGILKNLNKLKCAKPRPQDEVKKRILSY